MLSMYNVNGDGSKTTQRRTRRSIFHMVYQVYLLTISLLWLSSSSSDDAFLFVVSLSNIPPPPPSSSSTTSRRKLVTTAATTTTSPPLGNNNQQDNQKQKQQQQRIPILEYHNSWVCINKPIGITIHRSKSTPKHQAVLVSKLKRQLGRKVYPIHRLDHRTSGLMILAFNSETAGQLHAAAVAMTSTTPTTSVSVSSSSSNCSSSSSLKGQQQHQYENDNNNNNDDDKDIISPQISSQKQYIALVRGVWNMTQTNNNTGDESSSSTSSSSNNSIIVNEPIRVKDVYKSASTKFTVLATLDNVQQLDATSPTTNSTTTTMDENNNSSNKENKINNNQNEQQQEQQYQYHGACSLVLCEPMIGGRTHQIRKHAFMMGHPIIGDTQHGDTKINRWWRNHYQLNRLALHSFRISFPWRNDFDFDEIEKELEKEKEEQLVKNNDNVMKKGTTMSKSTLPSMTTTTPPPQLSFYVNQALQFIVKLHAMLTFHAIPAEVPQYAIGWSRL